MCFGTPYTVGLINNPTIEHEQTKIEMVGQYKYLETMLGPTLKFEKHTYYMRWKIVSRLRMLSKLRPILTGKTVLTLLQNPGDVHIGPYSHDI